MLVFFETFNCNKVDSLDSLKKLDDSMSFNIDIAFVRVQDSWDRA